jgi:ketosteroid isomerase-like protein
MAHPNETLLRESYAKFSRGDLAGYLSACTDTITFRVPGRSVVSGTFRRDQFISPMISTVIEQSGGSFVETVIDVVANDTRGVVFARHEFDRNGKRQAYNTAHVYRIEHGKLASFEEYPEDQYAFDAAWA